MSAEANFWAWRNGDARGLTKLILLCLAAKTHAGQRWVRIPTSQIVAATGVDKKTVPHCIQELQELGLVSVERIPGEASIFTLNIDGGDR